MTTTEDPDTRTVLLNHTTTIIAAFVSHNAVPTADLPSLICRTYEALENISLRQQKVEQPAALTPTPAVPIKKSVFDDHIVCLEDGKKFKSLRRHLMSQYNMTPAAYREKWGLGGDYPMVAPAYARARSDLAKEMGLGTQRKKALTPRTTSAAPARKQAKAAA